MAPEELEKAAVALRHWTMQQALPFWAQNGFDTGHGRFEERLSLSGATIVDCPVRLMVQARQIYVYALAERRRWYGGAGSLAERAYASMVRDYYRPDGRDGWVFSINRDGSVRDGKRDLYAHAFVLLAIASYAGMTGRKEALDLAGATLDYIDKEMRAVQGGFLDSQPCSDVVRRQNPHMHLFEGLLALWSVSGDRLYLDRASEIFDLFTNRFFHAERGTLGEYFGPALERAEGIAGDVVEPGHHYEWIWLLSWFARASGRDVRRYVDALYRHADTYGYGDFGLILDELRSDGSRHSEGYRAWPVTEAIKANLVEAELGRDGARAKAAALANLLRARFLTGCAPGGWVDRLDGNGLPSVDFMPASTLYHLACALDEMERVSGSLA